MKKLLFIALAFATLQATAQHKKEGNKREHRKDKLERISSMSAKDMAQIQTKKMTLHLDLTDAQQQQVSVINLKNAETRIAKAKERLKNIDETKKPSQEERVKRINEKLDAQIATKRKMKAILNAEQYEKWEKEKKRRDLHRKHGKKKGKKGMHKRKKDRAEQELEYKE